MCCNYLKCIQGDLKPLFKDAIQFHEYVCPVKTGNLGETCHGYWLLLADYLWWLIVLSVSNWAGMKLGRQCCFWREAICLSWGLKAAVVPAISQHSHTDTELVPNVYCCILENQFFRFTRAYNGLAKELSIQETFLSGCQIRNSLMQDESSSVWKHLTGGANALSLI